MSLPPLATISDILARAPELFTNLDSAQAEALAEALLEDASAIIRAEATREWVNDDGDELEGVPDGIPGICASMVIRALRGAEDGVRQESVGNWNATYVDSGLYLKTAERRFIAKASGHGRAFSIDTSGAVGYIGIVEDADWTL